MLLLQGQGESQKYFLEPTFRKVLVLLLQGQGGVPEVFSGTDVSKGFNAPSAGARGFQKYFLGPTFREIVRRRRRREPSETTM